VAVEYDEIGIWSEVKLAIVREYAAAYSKIMEAWRRDKISRLSWIYIDAYAGPGYHLSKTTGETVEGSPLIALNTDPPFHEYHFIDTEPARAKQLRELAGDRPDVHTYIGGCNAILLHDVFPRAKHSDYRRAFVPPRPVQHQPDLGRDRGGGEVPFYRDLPELHDHGHQPERSS
jgi:three-Cys-motif partner protein